MAGVRDDTVSPIVEPRGLPKDITTITRIDKEHGEAEWHTYSHLVDDEIKRLSAACRAPDAFASNRIDFYSIARSCFGESWDMLEFAPNLRTCGVESARWVFWFDN